MNIGKLRHQVEFQSYTFAKDSAGQVIKAWATYDTVWAWVRPIGGGEKLRAEQPVAELTHKVTIRYQSSLTAMDRIKFGTRYFYINSIVNYDEQNKYQEILCREKV